MFKKYEIEMFIKEAMLEYNGYVDEDSNFISVEVKDEEDYMDVKFITENKDGDMGIDRYKIKVDIMYNNGGI